MRVSSIGSRPCGVAGTTPWRDLATILAASVVGRDVAHLLRDYSSGSSMADLQRTYLLTSRHLEPGFRTDDGLTDRQDRVPVDYDLFWHHLVRLIFVRFGGRYLFTHPLISRFLLPPMEDLLRVTGKHRLRNQPWSAPHAVGGRARPSGHYGEA